MFDKTVIDTLQLPEAGNTAHVDLFVPADTVLVPTGEQTDAPALVLDIFGADSSGAVYEGAVSASAQWVLTGNVAYSIAVLVFFAGFCTLAWYFRPHMATVMGIFRGTLYIDKVIGEQNYIFETFRRLIILSGLLVTGLIIVRYCDYMWGYAIAGALPGWGILLAVPAVWAGLLAVWFFQNLILRVAGWLTCSDKFTGYLISLRNLGFSLMFLFAVPLMLTVSLAEKGSLGVLLWVVLIPVCALLIFILIRIYMLFIRQKISILYWILYLCAVEILPVSFLVVLTVRSLQ